MSDGKPAHSEDRSAAVAALREEFVRLLTTDSPHQDARRRDFNQAIFNAEHGYAIWTSTDLGMVLAKFDKAARNLGFATSRRAA